MTDRKKKISATSQKLMEKHDGLFRRLAGQPESYWEHRLIDHGEYVSIHAVYFVDGRPYAYCKATPLLEYKGGYPEMPTAREVLAEQLQKHAKALSLPPLKVSDFGGER